MPIVMVIVESFILIIQLWILVSANSAFNKCLYFIVSLPELPWRQKGHGGQGRRKREKIFFFLHQNP